MQQADILGRCLEGTGHWFLESPGFGAWIKGSPSRTLLCPGIPGAGKTFLSAIVVQALRQRFPGPETAVCFLYCNYRMRDEQNARNLLAGLVRQMLRPEQSSSQRVRALYDECKTQSRGARFNELSELLRYAASACSRVFVIVDALDECEGSEWPPLLSQLRLLQAELPYVRVMVTSRPQSFFEEAFDGAAKLEIRATSSDLEPYIVSQMPRLSKHVILSSGLKDEVVHKVIDAADGM